jgi:hypothetical protein
MVSDRCSTYVLLWMRPIRSRYAERTRRFAVVAMLVPFLCAQLAWLPLGSIGGSTRDVAAWSVCGERLCDCTPTPECALCPAGDTVVCAVASTAPRKTDRSESRDLQQRIATMIGALVAISDTNAGSPAIAAPALPRGYGWAFDGSMPASRALAPAAPPPWA